MPLPFSVAPLDLKQSNGADDIPQRVVDRLYIGSIHAATNEENLRMAGISHILNLSRVEELFRERFTYFNIKLFDNDESESNLLACIPFANFFIESGMDAGGCFVHCFAGKNRSAAVVMAFLLSSTGKSYDELYSELRDVRGQIEIKRIFEIQLRAYAAANFNIYDAQQLLLRRRLNALGKLRGNPALLSAMQNARSAQPSYSSPSRSRGSSFDNPNQITKPIVRPAGYQSPFNRSNSSSSSNSSNIQSGGNGNSEVTTPSNRGNSNPTSYDLNVKKGKKSGKDAKCEKTVYQQALSSVLDFPFTSSGTPHMTYNGPQYKYQSMRIIPPLMAIDSKYKCTYCNCELFGIASAVRVDMDLAKYSLEDNLFQADSKDLSIGTSSSSPISPPMTTRHSNHRSNSGGFDFGFSSGGSLGLCAQFDKQTSSECNSNGNSPSFSQEGGALSSRHASNLAADDKDYNNNNFLSSSFAGLKLSSSECTDEKKCSVSNNSNSNSNSNSSDESVSDAHSEGTSSSSRKDLHLNMSNLKASTSTFIYSQQHSSSSNSGSGSGSGSGSSSLLLESPSPRIPVPESRALEGTTPRNRPQSAERKRWTSRINLLNGNAQSLNESQKESRLAKLLDDDSEALKSAYDNSNDVYIYLEYLDWMGYDIFDNDSEKDSGFIHCRNISCREKVGSWLWYPSERQTLQGRLASPLIRISKKCIRRIDLQMDVTPTPTPRSSEVDSDYEV